MLYATQMVLSSERRSCITEHSRRPLFPAESRQQWQQWEMRDHGLYPQAEVEIGLQQRMHPAGVLAATIHAVISSPQRDDRDQPCS